MVLLWSCWSTLKDGKLTSPSERLLHCFIELEHIHRAWTMQQASPHGPGEGLLEKRLQRWGAHYYRAELDYSNLPLAKTQFASQESWPEGFSYWNLTVTAPFPTWYGGKFFKWTIYHVSPSPSPPELFPGLKSSHSFNHVDCDTLPVSSKFPFSWSFGLNC